MKRKRKHSKSNWWRKMNSQLINLGLKPVIRPNTKDAELYKDK